MPLTIGDVTILVVRDGAEAHDALADAVAAALGLPAGGLRVIHRCSRCGSTDHGVPALTHRGRPLPLAVSVSRADGVALAAFGAVAGLGVDVEVAGAAADPALERVLRHAVEAPYPGADARTRAWVRKEAALKAWGCGLHLEPATVHDRGGAAVAPGLPAATLHDLELDGYQAALAVIPAPGASC
ncbi:hypothetical protein GCM10025789_00360 [Tessaracoccus lubricantis]|uniref:4'-phosphopantetheinyl transferase domain-containing protein n=1 Tax=Tessaracoccus lubricantis TaxID=545543 RepID=A0ABP9EXD6_9ACTN